MNFTEIESWIENNILKDYCSINFLSKKEKIYNLHYSEKVDLNNLNNFFKIVGKKFKKVKEINSIYWFKINFIDNAISDLAGIGKINNFDELEIFTSLLTLDKANQNGDVVICLFDKSKKWIIKICNSADEKRIYIRLYGEGKILNLIETVGNKV